MTEAELTQDFISTFGNIKTKEEFDLIWDVTRDKEWLSQQEFDEKNIKKKTKEKPKKYETAKDIAGDKWEYDF